MNHELCIIQNKPNLPNAQMNVTAVLVKDYENKRNWTLGENKPNSNPILSASLLKTVGCRAFESCINFCSSF
jgi:hypothetical protein